MQRFASDHTSIHLFACSITPPPPSPFRAHANSNNPDNLLYFSLLFNLYLLSILPFSPQYYRNRLQIGNIGVRTVHGAPPSLNPEAEGRTQMALWCALKSPLLVGTFVHNMTQASRVTLSNAHAIAVNQDPLGVQARLVRDGGWMPDNPRPTHNRAFGYQVWTGPLNKGGVVAVLANLESNGTQVLTLSASDVAAVAITAAGAGQIGHQHHTRGTTGTSGMTGDNGIRSSSRNKRSADRIQSNDGANFAKKKLWNVTEAFSGERRSRVSLPLQYAVASHDAALLILTPVE